MASLSQWVQASRPKTLIIAIAPVSLGATAAAITGPISAVKTCLALVVAVSLVLGVNFANDYSDGLSGADTNRVGPFRLVGSGSAESELVKKVSWLFFAIAIVAGVVLSITSAWWLISVGALCLLGAILYTGGPRPYGYFGGGEVAVFIFFGLIATLGTQYVLSHMITFVGFFLAVGVGGYACAVMEVNNIRDRETDELAGKKTLAVQLGEGNARQLLLGFLLMGPVASMIISSWGYDWEQIGLFALIPGIRTYLPVHRGARGAELAPVFDNVLKTMIFWCFLSMVGFTMK